MFSTGPFERCERSEKAFVSALMQMHVCGVSIWKVAKVTEGLCGHRFSASTVSRIDAKLDAGLKQFAERSLEGPFPYLIPDARYEKVRSVFVCSEAHVCARVFLCLLACHVEWHMRRRLAPSSSTKTIRKQRGRSAPRRSSRPSPRPRHPNSRRHSSSWISIWRKCSRQMAGMNQRIALLTTKY